MDRSTRAALVNRVAGYFEGEQIPARWEDVSLTKRLVIQTNDPEAAQVWSGSMTAEVEAAVLAGKWGGEAPAARDLAAEREAAIQASLAQLQPKTQEELEAALKQRLADQETARRNSAVMSIGRWGQ